ncbi:potassium channel subfamily K member 1 [Hyalella azteca]|uniref:Potassium channel subfamily K member 1 n=1 Tax=Hyalella azteca TaxID=294128 RepID=A0A8B7NPN7_HYAAZ|nr:potassium channel subfamily K member 1 [Hyalella azteca]
MAPGSATYHTMEEEKNGDVSPITLCSMRRSVSLLLIYIPLYFAYVAGAALIFMVTEGAIEDAYRKRLVEKREAFLSENYCVSDEALEEFIEELASASRRGVSAARNASGDRNWSFGQSFFFSSTIVTTIGYGHVHPLSEGGKVFCIAFALMGIPMTFILLTALVDQIVRPIIWCLRRLEILLRQRQKPLNIQMIHFALISSVFFVLFLIIPAAIFSSIEKDWTFLDGFYYCFISLTTIGLGDYIPGDSLDQPLRPLYKIAIAAYLLLGLASVLTVVRLYNDIPELNLGYYLRPHADFPGPEQTRLVPNVADSGLQR